MDKIVGDKLLSLLLLEASLVSELNSDGHDDCDAMSSPSLSHPVREKSPRSTTAVMGERVDLLQRMILEGNANAICLQYARQAWGLSRSQGYKLLSKAWIQIESDLEEAGVERRQLLAWCISQLQTAVGVAIKQQNPGAVVGACRELDALCGLGVSGQSRSRRRS